MVPVRNGIGVLTQNLRVKSPSIERVSLASLATKFLSVSRLYSTSIVLFYPYFAAKPGKKQSISCVLSWKGNLAGTYVCLVQIWNPLVSKYEVARESRR